MQTHLITGGAGFIGFNLARALMADGHRVIAVDDLSRGTRENIEPLIGQADYEFVQLDCSDAGALTQLCRDLGQIGDVWHMAANSDIPAGVADPRVDLNQTFLTTFGVLQAMRACAIPRLHFASSSAIYGDMGEQSIHENIGPLEPISNYGAMKLASEAQIRAAVEAFLPRADIFRFPNVIGIPATHGVIWDFIRKLKVDPTRLEVLGDGSQQKAYLHVDDLVGAMIHISRMEGRFLVFNIGPSDEGITVRSIAEAVRDATFPEAAIHYGTGNRGWVGDVPRFRYSINRLIESGWAPSLGSDAAMRRAVDEIVHQELG